MRRISAAWLPASLIALALLVLAPAAAHTRGPPGGGGSAATAAPPEAGHAEAHPVGDQHSSVAERLLAQPGYISLCAGASLEPIDAIIDELRMQGSAEALLRLRDCLADTAFYHESDGALAELAERVASFDPCYRALPQLPPATKEAAVQATSQCIARTLSAR